MRCASRCRQRPLRERKGGDVPGGADYFYSASTGAVGLSNGLWGIMRSYDSEVERLDTAGQQSQGVQPVPRRRAPINYQNSLKPMPKPGSDEPQTEFRWWRIHKAKLAKALAGSSRFTRPHWYNTISKSWSTIVVERRHSA